jgi:hypothetical protein
MFTFFVDGLHGYLGLEGRSLSANIHLTILKKRWLVFAGATFGNQVIAIGPAFMRWQTYESYGVAHTPSCGLSIPFQGHSCHMSFCSIPVGLSDSYGGDNERSVLSTAGCPMKNPLVRIWA